MSTTSQMLLGWDVLVIDDDPMSLMVASMILKHHGASVHTATNGQEGLDIAKSLRPRFIISDLSMPVMDGWTMISELKRDLATHTIPAIALTAHAMVGDREKAVAAGFHNYLTKPLTPSTFMKDLVRLLTDIPGMAAELGIQSSN
jgi:two-component system cell cycle response regulator